MKIDFNFYEKAALFVGAFIMALGVVFSDWSSVVDASGTSLYFIGGAIISFVFGSKSQEEVVED